MSPWVELGEPITDADRFMTDATWFQWAERVAVEVEERGAWFLLGNRPDEKEFVFDVLDHMGRELPVVSLVGVLERRLRSRNVRTVRFFGRAS